MYATVEDGISYVKGRIPLQDSLSILVISLEEKPLKLDVDGL